MVHYTVLREMTEMDSKSSVVATSAVGGVRYLPGLPILEEIDMKWKPIEDAPHRRYPMFLVIAKDVTVNLPQFVTSGGAKYTSDPYCVWRNDDGSFARWPHPFPPTHYSELPTEYENA
jgi:hypothetical protein